MAAHQKRTTTKRHLFFFACLLLLLFIASSPTPTQAQIDVDIPLPTPPVSIITPIVNTTIGSLSPDRIVVVDPTPTSTAVTVKHPFSNTYNHATRVVMTRMSSLYQTDTATGGQTAAYNFTMEFQINTFDFNVYTKTWPGEYSAITDPNPTGPVLFEFGGASIDHYDINSTTPQTCSLEVCPDGDCANAAYALDIGIYSYEQPGSLSTYQNRVYLKHIPENIPLSNYQSMITSSEDLNYYLFHLSALVQQAGVWRFSCVNLVNRLQVVSGAPQQVALRMFSYNMRDGWGVFLDVNKPLTIPKPTEYPQPLSSLSYVGDVGGLSYWAEDDIYNFHLTLHRVPGVIDLTTEQASSFWPWFGEVDFEGSDMMVASAKSIEKYDFYNIGRTNLTIGPHYRKVPRYPEVASLSETHFVFPDALNQADGVKLVVFVNNVEYFTALGATYQLIFQSGNDANNIYTISPTAQFDFSQGSDNRLVFDINQTHLGRIRSLMGRSTQYSFFLSRQHYPVGQLRDNAVTVRTRLFFENAPKASQWAYSPELSAASFSEVAPLFYNNIQLNPFFKIATINTGGTTFDPYCSTPNSVVENWKCSAPLPAPSDVGEVQLTTNAGNILEICKELRPTYLRTRGGAVQNVTAQLDVFTISNPTAPKMQCLSTSGHAVLHADFFDPQQATTTLPLPRRAPYHLLTNTSVWANIMPMGYELHTKYTTSTSPQMRSVKIIVFVEGILAKYLTPQYINTAEILPTLKLSTNPTTLLTNLPPNNKVLSIEFVSQTAQRQPLSRPYVIINLDLAELVTTVEAVASESFAIPEPALINGMGIHINFLGQALPMSFVLPQRFICLPSQTWDGLTSTCVDKCSLAAGTIANVVTGRCECVNTTYVATQWHDPGLKTNPSQCTPCPCGVATSTCTFNSTNIAQPFTCRCADPNFTGMQCDKPTTCQNVCDARFNLKHAFTNTTAPSTCPTTCACLEGYTPTTRTTTTNAITACTCTKQKDAQTFYDNLLQQKGGNATAITPSDYYHSGKCHVLNTHNVTWSSTRCAVMDDVMVDNTQQASLVLQPTQQIKQCICRHGWAGQWCEYPSVLAEYTIKPESYDTLITGVLPLEMLYQIFDTWQDTIFTPGNTVKIALYQYNPENATIIMELWVENKFPPASPFVVMEDGQQDHQQHVLFLAQRLKEKQQQRQGVLASKFKAQLRDILTHEQFHHQQQQQHQQMKKQKLQHFTPLDTTTQTDLSSLFALWESMQGTNNPNSATTADKIMDPQCNASAQTPAHCANSTAIAANNDQSFDKQTQADEESKSLFSTTPKKNEKTKIGGAVIVIIAVVCGVTVFFIITVVGIVYCRKNEKACFAKKKEDNAPTTTKNKKSAQKYEVSRASTAASTTELTSTTLSDTIMPTNQSTMKSATHDKQLPPGWQVQIDVSTGKEYFLNLETMESSWVHPSSPEAKSENGW